MRKGARTAASAKRRTLVTVRIRGEIVYLGDRSD